MSATKQSRRFLAIVAYFLVFSSWLALSALLWRSGPNLERYLRTALNPRHADAFNGLSGIAGLFWCLHSLLCVIAATAVRRRRFDMLTVLLIGPSLAAILLGFEEDWSDPAWFTITGVMSIGYIVGIPVTLVWWVLGRIADRARPQDNRALVTENESDGRR